MITSRFNVFCFSLFLVGLVYCTPGSAAIVGFQAEDGSLGSQWDVTADGGALGGNYIVTNATQTGNNPASSNAVAGYSPTLASGLYDLYARIYVDNSGFNAAGVDSVFIGNGFGSKVVTTDTDWITVNDLQEGANTYVDPEGGEFNNDTWTWLKFSTQVTVAETVPQFTSTGATETFQIGHREALWIDAFAFVTDGETPTSAQLTAAVLAPPTTQVPEPSTLALALIGLLTLRRTIRRRRS